MRRHPKLTKLLLAVVAVVALLVLLSVQGSLEIAHSGHPAAAWTAPCFAGPPRSDRELLARCARVRGRVLWVNRKGALPYEEVHVLLTVDLGLVLVKLINPEPSAVPGLGRTFVGVGPMVRSSSGLREVQGFAVH